MTQAFISYSHSDRHYLDRLHVHLANLKRDHKFFAWTDTVMTGGAVVNNAILQALNNAGFFLAILSPDYLASDYAVNTEFKRALELQVKGTLTIVPVIAQPCEWKKTAFGNLIALPRDGKPISDWTNENNAFLSVVEELRRLIEPAAVPSPVIPVPGAAVQGAKTFKIKRNFDAIEKFEFRNNAFEQIRNYFVSAVDEINSLADIKAKVTENQPGKLITCLIINRAMNSQEGYITISNQVADMFACEGISHALAASIIPNLPGSFYAFEHDEYELYWSERDGYATIGAEKVTDPALIAEKLWKSFIGQVGITY
jgi:hypothetical protein